MDPQLVSLLVIPATLAAVLIPVVAAALGRRAARKRREAELPLRYPRPAVVAAGERPAVPTQGPPPLASGEAAAPDVADPAALAEALAARYGLRAEIREDPEGWEVELAPLAKSTEIRGGEACRYDAGLLAGAFARIAEGPVDVRETACAADGAERCAFEVRPTTVGPWPTEAARRPRT